MPVANGETFYFVITSRSRDNAPVLTSATAFFSLEGVIFDIPGEERKN